MKILIADDDYKTRRLLKDILSPYGECDEVYNGEEVTEAFSLAWEEKSPYDLICLDIMMPETDGQSALMQIREIERGIGLRPADEVRVIMISALDDPATVMKSYAKGGATSYIVKPVNRDKLIAEIKKTGLIS